MDDLICRLKEDHRRLGVEFQRISCGIPANEFELAIQNIHDALFSHLELENEKFYPHIEKKTGDTDTRVIISSFKSINKILPDLKRFCAGIAAGRPDGSREAHGHLLNLFLQRFKREEELLFAGLLRKMNLHNAG